MADAGELRGMEPGSLPAYFEFAAPADWQAIEFMSDLHLCAEMPRTYDAWAAHLRSTSADAVFILGDLFEVWVGDDMRQLPFERQCTEVLAEAACRMHLAFMAGNRDFLVGSTLLREAGVMSLPDPTVLNAWGQRILLSHGDALCLADKPYQAFRRQVRSSQWQTEFLSQPLAERCEQAAEMRRVSAARQRTQAQDNEFDTLTDIDASEAVRWLHGLGAPELVHGHTHRPGSQMLAPGFKRHVLSDWDLDNGNAKRAEVLRLERSGFQRQSPTQPA